MKNKILLGVLLILIFVYIGVIKFKKNNHSFFNNDQNITVKNNDKLETLNLEEYLIGVLAGEIPASFHPEALKAQAVAARSYAMYKINTNTNNNFDIIADITNQVYINKEKMQEIWGSQYNYYLDKITNAVNNTKDEVMYYQDNIIEAFYFSMSNGYTEESLSVFSENLPYIKSVTSKWDNEDLKNFYVTTTFNKYDFCLKLNLNTCNNIIINNITNTNTGRIDKITINNQEFKGTEVRKKLNLRSTDFNIIINKDITITTKGYGHGVGMSQYGANGMAKDGFTYQEILNYYYKDIIIKKRV